MKKKFEHWSELLMIVHDARKYINRNLDEISKAHNLTINQMFLLLGIYANVITTIKDAASTLCLQQTNTSTLCTNLEQEGLIERRRNLEDIRVVNLFLTFEGKEKIKAILDYAEKEIEYIIKNEDTRIEYEKVIDGFFAYHRLLKKVDNLKKITLD